MERDTYLVLRVTRTGADTYDPLRRYEWRFDESTESAPMVECQIEEQTLDPQDYREARDDPQVAAVAAPEASAAPAHLHEATWGVFVSGALQSPYAGYGVTVAVLDTGIDAGHEAFDGVTLIQRDFTGEGDGDENGHGTHVAGTIFGQAVQGLRFGVAPGVRRALIGKVLGTRRSPTTKELVDAVQWAVDQGARIINMSLGFDFPGLVKWWTDRGMEADLATSRALAQYRDNIRLFDEFVNFLRARAAYSPSALIVAAAGNESKRHVRPDYAIEVAPPAAAEGIVAVAALQTAGAPHDALAVAPFSNVRAAVAAPGVGVYSAQKGGGYTYKSGTSMASPHVAGVAALWAERQIQLSGTVNVNALGDQLRGHASRERLPDANSMDVGQGLVTAPQD